MIDKLWLTLLALLAAVPSLSLLGGCGSEDRSPPENSGGAPTGGASPFAGGATGLGSGGQSNSAGSGLGGVGSGGLGSGGLGASSGGMGIGGAVAATFDTFKFVIQQAPCFGAGCHNDEQNPLDLRLDDQLHARVTAVVSENCGNIPVVNPGKPEESALVTLLRGPCGETQRMPLGCVNDWDANCVPPEYITAIEQWIAMGAPEQ